MMTISLIMGVALLLTIIGSAVSYGVFMGKVTARLDALEKTLQAYMLSSGNRANSTNSQHHIDEAALNKRLNDIDQRLSRIEGKLFEGVAIKG